MRTYIIIGLVALFAIFLIGGIAYTMLAPVGAVTPIGNATSTDTVATSTEAPYVISQVAIEDWRDYMPSLDREVVFDKSIPENARKVVREKVVYFQGLLKADPTRVVDWLDLGVWFHTGNDYEGARLVWEFLVKAIPQDTTAYDNLAKLYHFDLKDFPKAEEYFLKSLELNPENMTTYLELHTLYRYSYKTDTALAVDVLERAATKFPADADPLTSLGLYYRETGEPAKARDAYERALDRARVSGDVTLIASIGDELAKLPE